MTGACHRCEAPVEAERVGVRDVCEHCRAYLHCCRNCDLYDPGAHNDCREPSAEMVADKEQGNFCDYFQLSPPRGRAPARSGGARAALEKLFRKP